MIALAATLGDASVGISGLNEIYGIACGISSGLALSALAYCAIKYMTASDTKDASEASHGAKQVIIAWVLINIFGLFINSVFSILGNITL